MGGLDGSFLCISVSYKTLLFGQTLENRKDFNKWKCRRHIISSRGNHRRKWMRRGKHETFIFSKVVNSKWILWMESGLDHILKDWRVLFFLIGSGDFYQRCVLESSVCKWNSKGGIRAEKSNWCWQDNYQAFTRVKVRGTEKLI